MNPEPKVVVVNVFTEQGRGGNPCPIVLDATSMLVRVASTAILDRMTPRFGDMQALCERLGSTGLYPFAVSDAAPSTLEARQFPKASGYPEDAATGIAATALFGALGHYGIDVPPGKTIDILQGRAMGRLSRMSVVQEDGQSGAQAYWLSGDVTPQAP